MSSISPRSYNCKDEELPIVGGFSAISLSRDLNDFSGYSPMFDQPYVDSYNAKIEAAQELVQPNQKRLR